MISTGGEITFLISGLIAMNKKYLLDDKNLKNIKAVINDAEKVLLFLDYDGTLAPFKADPLSAAALPDSEKSLKKLEQDPKFYLNLVSGRKLSELKKMIDINKAGYAGSHGLEIDLPFKKEIIYPQESEEIDVMSKKNYQKVKEKYRESDLAELEDKGFGLALHFDLESEQKKVVSELQSLFENSAYQLLSGRKVIEIRPRGWDKGKAVNYISDQIRENQETDKFLRIYIGDDRTDEDAFKVLKDGISIYVQNEGDLNTEAEYYLKNPEDTAKLLKKLAGEA